MKKEISMGIIAISLVIFPLPTIICLILYKLGSKLYDKLYSAKYLLITGIFVLLITYIFKISTIEEIKENATYFLKILKVIFSESNSVNISKWILSFNITGYSLSAVFIGLGMLISNKHSYSKVNKKEESVQFCTLSNKKLEKNKRGQDCHHDKLKSKSRKKNQMEIENKEVSKYKDDIDLKTKKHIFTTGTTGSGKTANILRYVEERFKNNEFICIVDGKGDMGKYSLYDVTVKLAKKYGRKVYLMNQTDIAKTDPYNPFLDVTATQIKDMIIYMSEWESDHYKSLASRYWQCMADVMLLDGITPSFESIIYFSYRENFKILVDSALKKKTISKEMSKLAYELIDGDSGKQAEISISRGAVIAEGDGKRLFGTSKDSWNIKRAYEENAVVIVLLNDFNYGDFAISMGKLVLDDIKNMVGERLKKSDNKSSLLVLEELGVYVDNGIEGLLNRTRTAGIQTIVSVQTFADIDKTNEHLTRQILGNCNEFIIMRTIDNDTAETISKTIGTRSTIEQTRRTDYGEDTGMSSNKIVDEFILNPNEIKNLKDSTGYYYSKNTPDEVTKFKTKFVEVN